LETFEPEEARIKQTAKPWQIGEGMRYENEYKFS